MEEEQKNTVEEAPSPFSNKPIKLSRGLIIISLGLLVLLGLNSLKSPNNPGNTPPAEVAGTSTTPTPEAVDTTKPYTLDEVAKHNQKTNCWLAIEGKIYDVTPFSSSGEHPGGDTILQGCGKDATKLFNTRPMGSKTPHSEKARKFLESFLIGVLAE